MATNDIEARVIQKIATEAEWAASTILPRKGEFMIVGDSSGTPVNIKVGNGVDMYPELPYMFDSIQQNVGYIAITSNALPTPSDEVAWGIVSGGVYTFGGNPAFTVPDGHWGIANYSSGAWSFVDMGELPDSSAKAVDWQAGTYYANQTSVKDGVLYRVKPSVTSTTGEPGVSEDWESIGEDVLKFNKSRADYNESSFIIGSFTNPNDTNWRNSGKVRLFRGGTVFATVATNSGGDSNLIRVFNLDGSLRETVRVSVGGSLQTISYKAKEEVDVVVYHRYGTVSSGYSYSLVENSPYITQRQKISTLNTLLPTSKFSENILSESGRISINGSPQSHALFRRSDYIPVKQGDIIEAIGYFDSSTRAITFFTGVSTDTYIGGTDVINAYNVLNRLSYEAPSDGYVRLCSIIENPATYPFFLISSKNKDTDIRDFTEVKDVEGGLLSYANGIHIMDGKSTHYVKNNYDSTGGIISFIDDDGHVDVYNYLYPLMRSKGFPMGLAIAGGLIENGSFQGRPLMSKEQLIEVADDTDFIEIYNHSYSHPVGSDINARQQFEEVYKNDRWLKELGLRPSGYVTPFGIANSTYLNAISDFYESNYSTNARVTTLQNLRNLDVGRISFGNNYPYAPTKAMVDECIANNGWLVICTHISGYDRYDEWRTDFELLLDYIDASEATVLMPSDAFSRAKNKIEIRGDIKISRDGLKRSY